MTSDRSKYTDNPGSVPIHERGPTYTEEFKLECLKRHRQRYQEKAREVMMMPKESRFKFYQEYEMQRGKEDLKLFIEEVNRQWKSANE